MNNKYKEGIKMEDNYIDDLLNNISLSSEVNFDLFKEVVLSAAFMNNTDLIQQTRRSDIMEVEKNCLYITKIFLKGFNLNDFVRKYKIDANLLIAEAKGYVFVGNSLNDKSTSDILKTFIIKQTQNILYTIILDLPKNYTFNKASFSNSAITA
jgi:hypothetical protein